MKKTAAVLMLFVFVACNGSSYLRQKTLAVAPNPAPLVYGGQSQQFTATLGGKATSASWSLSYGLGTISASGLYRAPADQTGWNTVVVTASVGGQSVSVPQPVGPTPVVVGTGGASGSGGATGSGGSGTGGSVSSGGSPGSGGASGSGGTGGSSVAQRPSYNTGAGFFVVNGQIYDPNGNAFRPVGMNKLHFDAGSPGLFGSNPTRSNAVRWVIDFNQSASTNLGLMQKSHDAGQVAIPGNWDGTCNNDTATLSAIVDTWIAQAPTWLQVDNQILLNIANEWGPWGSTLWRDAYVSAVGRLRDAGYRAPIVIDGGGCGQDPNDAISYGQAIEDADPQHNVIFSVHIYGGWANGHGTGYQQNDLHTSLDALKATGLPILCGEFGPGRQIGPSPTEMTPLEIMSACTDRGFGWLAWAFDDPAGEYTPGGCDDNWFCISRTGDYTGSSDLTIFGRDVIEDPTYGIKATSIKATIFP